MKRVLMLLIIAGLFIFNGCEDTDRDDMKLQFIETQCNNPWSALPDEGNYLVEVRKFLVEAGINVVTLNIEYYDESGNFCPECDCVTGRSIILVTPVVTVRKAEDLGFTVVQ